MKKELLILALLATIPGCVIPQKCECPPPGATPTAMPSRKPLPTAIPPFPTVTPEPQVPFALIQAPKEIEKGAEFMILVAAGQSDHVVIWADKMFHVGTMFWDSAKKQKYLKVSLSTVGKRTLDFKLNGSFVMSHEIVVEE